MKKKQKNLKRVRSDSTNPSTSDETKAPKSVRPIKARRKNTRSTSTYKLTPKRILNCSFYLVLFLHIVEPFASRFAAYRKVFLENQTGFLIIGTILGVIFTAWNIADLDTSIADQEKLISGTADNHDRVDTAESPWYMRIPILNRIAIWMRSEGWVYSSAYVIVLILAATVIFYKLGYFDFGWDEYQTVGTATSHMKDGVFHDWDYVKEQASESPYLRAWPHSWLVSKTFAVFGISEWSARLASALAGMVFFVVLYAVARYFTRDRFIALAITAAILLNTRLVYFFRFARMYALLLPLFMATFYTLYRAITSENSWTAGDGRIRGFLSRYLNYHPGYILLTVLLAVAMSSLHSIQLVIFPAAVIFIFALALYSREPKYVITTITIITGAVFGILLVLLWDQSGIPEKLQGKVSFFEMRNTVYLDLMVNYPFPKNAAILILGTGLSLTILTKNRNLKTRLLYLYCVVLFCLVFFVYIADRYAQYRYIIHCIAISSFLIIYIFLLLIGRIRVPALRYVFLICFFANIAHLFGKGKGELYDRNSMHGWPSVAYEAINTNFDVENDILIAGPYLRVHYVERVGEIKHTRSYFPVFHENILADIRKRPSGWLTWETFFEKLHVDQRTVEYANSKFEKLHGKGIDNIGVEVFRFRRDMIDDVQPNARLDLSKPITFCFWVKTNLLKLNTPTTPSVPVVLLPKTLEGLWMEAYRVLEGHSTVNVNGYKFIYGDISTENVLSTGHIADGQWHHILWYQGKKGIDATMGLYVDGNLAGEKIIPGFINTFDDVLIAETFGGEVQDIRVYDFAVSLAQVTAIYNDGEIRKERVLSTPDGAKFEPSRQFNITILR